MPRTAAGGRVRGRRTPRGGAKMLQEAGAGGGGDGDEDGQVHPGRRRGRGPSPGRLCRREQAPAVALGASLPVEGMPGGPGAGPGSRPGAARGGEWGWAAAGAGRPGAAGSGQRGRPLTCLLRPGPRGGRAAGPGRAGARGAALRGRRRRQGPAAAAPQLAGRAVSQRETRARTERLRGCGQRAGTTPLYQVGNSRRAPSADAAPPELMTMQQPPRGAGAQAACAYWSSRAPPTSPPRPRARGPAPAGPAPAASASGLWRGSAIHLQPIFSRLEHRP